MAQVREMPLLIESGPGGKRERVRKSPTKSCFERVEVEMTGHGFTTDDPERMKHGCLMASGLGSSVLQAGRAVAFAEAFSTCPNPIG